MFVFDVTQIISYIDYRNYISNLKVKFDTEKYNLFNEYNVAGNVEFCFNQDKYFEFRNKYRDLRQRVIKDVLKKFRSFLPDECLIYEFGSLTKLTDRIESDTDLTICYDERKNYLYECAEELINYTIIYVFEHSIDHIHGKFQHYPMIHDYDNLSEKDNLFILKFDNGSIKYKCGPETLSENLMNIKNVRNYNALIDGYREKYMLKCNIDCLYSIEIIENTTKYDFIRDLSLLEKQNNIFSKYKYVYKFYKFENSIEISYIKKALKDTIVSLYIMISFLRKRIKWLNNYSMTMDDVFESCELKLFFGDEYINKLKYRFIKMIFYWDKIELLLKKNNVILSTRCHKRYDYNELNNMLDADYNQKNMLEEILLSINELNSSVLDGWRIIDEKC